MKRAHEQGGTGPFADDSTDKEPGRGAVRR